jgi:hypothetical protein
MELALRGASVVLVVVTTNFVRSKFCLQELHWALDETQRRSQQAQQGWQPLGPLEVVPIFYHDQDPTVGFGVNSFKRSALQLMMDEHHAAASSAERAPWLDALMVLSERKGIRQDSVGRCGKNDA